ncbi:hypothetical protein [Nocardia sp. NPDC051832]|uniref:hypothetical protein n=1 Tax=Nocardia sp. NPDC051832 TaxID=3155673 RepID=UPI00342D3FF3
MATTASARTGLVRSAAVVRLPGTAGRVPPRALGDGAGRAMVGALVGALVAALAVAAHGAAGGGFPGSAEGALVLLAAALTGSAAAATRSGQSRCGILALLAAGQFASHSLLSTFNAHDHEPVRAQLPGGWMLAAHAIASLLCAALVLLARRLYLVASGAVRAALTRPHEPRPPAAATGWTTPGPASYRFHPNGAIGPRAPPVPA